ncbi:GNAT family N-acetyltransferase [Myceligenerans crystallogenes]
MDDPLVRPMLDELAQEYRSRYHRFTEEDVREEMERYPAREFRPPDGELLLLLDDGEPVAGGAFRRRTEPELGDPARLARPDARDAGGAPVVPTAELKRIWTSSAHRRKGLARRVVAELERRAVALGYARLYLTTGPLQPEAEGLYLATGYTPLYDAPRRAGGSGEPTVSLPFEKWLVP